MMKKVSIHTLLMTIALASSPPLWAGPDWRAIESAREAEKTKKDQQADQAMKQESTLERLQTACDKAKSDAELSRLCQEILASYKELTN